MTVATQASAADRASEERAIRQADAEWSDALAKKDLDAVMDNYAEDAAFLAPNQPTLFGKHRIREWFEQRIATPGYSARFAPSHVVVSESLEMAYELGTYQVSWIAEGGEHMAGVGKHLVTWQKRDGAWKVVAESISPDAPPQRKGSPK